MSVRCLTPRVRKRRKQHECVLEINLAERVKCASGSGQGDRHVEDYTNDQWMA